MRQSVRESRLLHLAGAFCRIFLLVTVLF